MLIAASGGLRTRPDSDEDQDPHLDHRRLYVPAVLARFSGADVVETLGRVGKCCGLPKVVRVD